MGLNPCVRGECVNAICEIGDFSPFLPLCLWRIVYYQRLAKTENGSDLIKNGAPFFCQAKNMKPSASLNAVSAALHDPQDRFIRQSRVSFSA